ncbi:MAG: hypothetical protein M1830_002139 [Pleopsidium flavum]|nr:MAG: hypothetical protein M1830_002139 [Pleopsidium flavum]
MGLPKPKEGLYTAKMNRRKCYDHFLDLLDFKPGTRMRQQFKHDVIDYHSKSLRWSVRKEDGEKFTALVKEFLDKYGVKYFGEGPRFHLWISEPSVGLLYPRDAETEESYLWKTIANILQWRAECTPDRFRNRLRPSSPDGPPTPPDTSRLKHRVTETEDQHLGYERAKRRAANAVISSSSEPSYGILPRYESNLAHQARSSRRPDGPQAPITLPLHHLRDIIDLTIPDVKPVKREELILRPSEVPSRLETATTKPETPALLSRAIINGTSLSVRVSNQPCVAPAFVSLNLCLDFQALFPILVAECDVQTSSTMKITKISVTFPWNGEQLRLRRGREEDWRLFCSTLRRRWQNPEDFEGGVCKVEMLIHVDG